MPSRLLNLLFRKKDEIPTPLDKKVDAVVIYLNIEQHQHMLVWVTDNNNHSQYGHPRLVLEIREWLSNNMPNTRSMPSTVSNWVLEVRFENARDATLFKLFWM